MSHISRTPYLEIKYAILLSILSLITFSGCKDLGIPGPGGILIPPFPTPTSPSQPPIPIISPLPIPSPSPSPTPTRTPHTYKTDALLFTGDGVWAAEVDSLKSILEENKATYREVDSEELNNMTLDEIAEFGIFIVPGGSGQTETDSLSSATRQRLRDAIQIRGVSWIGFCAGSFIAVAPKPAPGKDASYGIGVVDGPVLGYYYLEDEGTDIAMTLETFADGSKHDLVWYGGPVTPNIPGTVVAKYPDGNPAISQIWSGNGFVMLSAVHPAAPEEIRDIYGLEDSDGLDYKLTWTLIDSALKQRPLPVFKD